MASLNTHDMAPFAALLEALDFEDRRALGLLDEKSVTRERETRRATVAALLGDLHRKGRLAGDGPPNPAVIRVLITLENLREETRPQNVPSTVDLRPNWRRKLRLGLEEVTRIVAVREVLESVDRLRNNAGER